MDSPHATRPRASDDAAGSSPRIGFVASSSPASGSAGAPNSAGMPPPLLGSGSVDQTEVTDQFRAEARAAALWFDALDTRERTYICDQLFARATEAQLRTFERSLQRALQRPAAPTSSAQNGSPASSSARSERFEVFERLARDPGRFRAPATTNSPFGPSPGSGFASDIYSQAFLRPGNTPWGMSTQQDMAINRPKSASAGPSPTWGPASTPVGSVSATTVSLTKGWAPSPIGRPSEKPWRSSTPAPVGSLGPVPGSVSSSVSSSVSAPPMSSSLPGSLGAVGSPTNGHSHGVVHGVAGSTPLGPPGPPGPPVGPQVGKSQVIPTPHNPQSSTSPHHTPPETHQYLQSAPGSTSASSPPTSSVPIATPNTTSASSHASSTMAAGTSPPRPSANTASAVSGAKGPSLRDPRLLSDIGAWLRSLRLHKYTGNLSGMPWQDVVQLTEADLEARGVNALGARRKMLKMFEEIRAAQATGELPK